MFRTGGIQSLRRAQQIYIRQATRRFAHDDHGHAAHAGPTSESFGRSFYLALTLVPCTYLLWKLSRPADDQSPNAWTRALTAYSDYKQMWEERNALHTRAVVQAGHDRNLFLNSPQPNYVDLRFPEVFHVGSPYNVSAGNGSANIDGLVAHYREKAFKEEEEKLQKIKDGVPLGRQEVERATVKGGQ